MPNASGPASNSEHVSEKKRSLRESLSHWLSQKGGRDLIGTFVICLVAAGGLFLLRYYVANELKGHGLANQLLTELTIAFMVAGILSLVIEINAHRRAARENKEFAESIAQDVFGGILKHVVPPVIFDEINRLLRSNFIRLDCEYTITFSDKDMPRGFMTIYREVAFDVENLSEEEVTFPVRSSYSGHPEIISSEIDRQFHIRLDINHKLVNDLARHLETEGTFMHLNYPLRIKPRSKASVYMRGGEPYPAQPGSNSYTQGSPCDSLKVRIVNECPKVIKDVDLLMHHPARAEVVSHTRGDYFLNRAFLPGQGFEIRWTLMKNRG